MNFDKLAIGDIFNWRGHAFVKVEPNADRAANAIALRADCPYTEVQMGDLSPITHVPNSNPSVGWQFLDENGKWCFGYDVRDHRKHTEAAGYIVRDVYAKP